MTLSKHLLHTIAFVIINSLVVSSCNSQSTDIEKVNSDSNSEITHSIIGTWKLAEMHLKEEQVFDWNNFELYFNYHWSKTYLDKGISAEDSIVKRKSGLELFDEMCQTTLIIKNDSTFTVASGERIQQKGKYSYKTDNVLIEDNGRAKIPIEYKVKDDLLIMINNTHRYMKMVYMRQ